MLLLSFLLFFFFFAAVMSAEETDTLPRRGAVSAHRFWLCATGHEVVRSMPVSTLAGSECLKCGVLIFPYLLKNSEWKNMKTYTTAVSGSLSTFLRLEALFLISYAIRDITISKKERKKKKRKT